MTRKRFGWEEDNDDILPGRKDISSGSKSGGVFFPGLKAEEEERERMRRKKEKEKRKLEEEEIIEPPESFYDTREGKQLVKDFLTGKAIGVSPEELEAQKTAFLEKAKRDEERRADVMRSRAEAVGGGMGSAQIAEEGAQEIREREYRDEGIRQLDYTNQMAKLKSFAVAVDLIGEKEGLDRAIWLTMNQNQQNKFERDLKKQLVEVGLISELADIKARADASGGSFGEAAIRFAFEKINSGDLDSESAARIIGLL